MTDMESEEETSASQITLMTLHAAKDLSSQLCSLSEWKTGFSHQDAPLQEDGEEEERRLAYVGITRAEKKLFMTRAYSPTSLREDTKLSWVTIHARNWWQPVRKEGVTVSDSYYSSRFLYERFRNLLMERVAKRHLMAHVAPPQSTSSTGGGGLFDRYRSSSQSSSGGWLFTKETNDTSAYSTCR